MLGAEDAGEVRGTASETDRETGTQPEAQEFKSGKRHSEMKKSETNTYKENKYHNFDMIML